MEEKGMTMDQFVEARTNELAGEEIGRLSNALIRLRAENEALRQVVKQLQDQEEGVENDGSEEQTATAN